jgi:hypothetical protein
MPGQGEKCDASEASPPARQPPAQAKLGRGTLQSSNDCDGPGHPPADPVPNWESRTHPFRKGRGKGWGTRFVGGAEIYGPAAALLSKIGKKGWASPRGFLAHAGEWGGVCRLQAGKQW